MASNTETVHVSRLIERMDQLRTLTPPQKATLKLNLLQNLPLINADPAEVRRLVAGLVSFVCGATNNLSPVVRLATGVASVASEDLPEVIDGADMPPGQYVYIELVDESSGVSPDQQDRTGVLSDPVEPLEPQQSLTDIHGLIKKLGGWIKVRGKTGRVTTVTVLLPTLVQQAGQGQVSTGTAVLGTGTILIVDDDDDVRVVSKAYVETLGFKTLLARDGVEAVRVVREHADEIDLILLDLTMPRMDGGEAFRQIREFAPELKILLVSGYSHEEAIKEFLGQGLAAFMQKPYDLKTLRATLNEILY